MQSIKKCQMTFENWVTTATPEILEVGTIVQKRLHNGQSLYANHLEEILDISGVALKLQEECSEWHTLKILEICNQLKKEFPNGNAKTQLDTAKAYPCNELTLLQRIKAMNKTIELKTTQIQSLIKYYSK